MFGQIGGQQGIGGPIPNSIGGESFIRHVGNDKLIYDFHEGSGTIVYDKSHCGNNGTLGATTAAPTWRRNSLYFDGGDYVDCGNDSSLNILNAITIETWVKPSALNAYQILIAKQRDEINSNLTYGIRLSDANESIGYAHTTSPQNTGLSTTLINTNNKYHVVVSNNGTDFPIYINGAYENKGTGGTMESNTTYKVYLGVWWAVTTGIQYFTGEMYSIRTLNKGLSGIECQQEYLADKFKGNN